MNILQRPFKYTYHSSVFVLIGINILVFILQKTFPVITAYASMVPALVISQHWLWQFVTYMFAHDPSNISHLLFNMLALFVFGMQVERQMGTKEFLLYYFVTGILAGVFSFAVFCATGSYGVFLLGASGAVFAVQLAYATFFPNAVLLLWGIIPLRAPVLVLGFTALEIVFVLTGRQSNVAHLTHLAGFAFGWLYFLIRFRINPWKHLIRRR